MKLKEKMREDQAKSADGKDEGPEFLLEDQMRGLV